MQQFGAQTTVLNVLLYKTKEVSNTKNINVNVTRPPTNIQLGRQGENRATCIIFDCTGLVQLYGDGTAELLHELKDGTIYPVAVQQEGASVSWIVTASDTATVGAGRAELRWYVGDTLAKSAKFRTSVSSALADSTTETPPTPQKSWVDEVLAAAQEIKDGAISDEKLAAAIAAYLEEHPIDAGLDETALAAYLTENGYLTDAALADAVAQALAEAKASGQFDGEPGKDGVDGADGADGVGIESVMQTTTSAEDGGTNVITVTKTDGSTSTFEVRNGSKGSDGADGQPGTNGKSAYQYAVEGGYTGTEAEFAAKLAEEMPDTLPNPNALTFTGAVSGSYDGSEALTVEIPSGSGGSVEAVSWKLIRTIDIVSGTSIYSFNTDNNGNAFKIKNFLILIDTYPTNGYFEIKPNGNFSFYQTQRGRQGYPFSFMMKMATDGRYILENSTTDQSVFERKISSEYSSFGEFTSFGFWFSTTPASDTTMYILGEDV